MKLPYLYRALIIILILFCSCSESSNNGTTNISYNTRINDSIITYLDKARDGEFEIKKRLNFAKKAYDIALQNKRDSLKNQASLSISYLYYFNRDKSLFLKHNGHSLSLAISSRDSSSMARSYGYFGNFYLREDQNDSAYYYFYKAENLYGKLKGRSLNRGRMLLNMGIVQKNEKDFIGGEVTTFEAINYIPKEGEERTLASAYNNLGIISKELENFEDAIKYHQKAYNLRRKAKNLRRLEAGSLSNLGVTYQEKKDYPEAIKFYNRALGYDSISVTRPKTYARLLNNRAYAKFLNKDTDGVLEDFLESLKIRDSIQDESGLISSNSHLAEYFANIGDTIIAIEHAKKSRDIAQSLKNYGEMLEPLLLLAKLDMGTEGSSSSLRYIRISDSLQKAERAIRNKFARIRFETNEIEEQNRKIARQNNWLIIITSIFFVIATLLYLVIKERARNKQLTFDQKQQQSNEEIYNLMISQQTKLEEGRQQEKQRVSQELHDGVLSKLFGTRLSLDSLNTRSDDDSIETRNRYLDELKSIEQEIRKISHDLNAEIFDVNLGYKEVISNLINKQILISDVGCEFYNDPTINWEGIPNKVKIHLYRILQESLQNINKHAKATKVTVSFKKEESTLILQIQDNGVGFDGNRVKNGIGLKNIKSRVKELKGKLNFISTKGKGSTINISLRLDEGPRKINKDYNYGKKAEHIND